MNAAKTALACGLALAFTGCAGPTPYRDDIAPKNVNVRTATASDVRAVVGVHSVDAQCRAQYLGVVALDKPSIAIGIPPERWSYLLFQFSTSSLLGSSRSAVSKGTLLKPRAGYRYEVDVSYRDDIYNVVVREKTPRGRDREIPLLELDSCGQGSALR